MRAAQSNIAETAVSPSGVPKGTRSVNTQLAPASVTASAGDGRDDEPSSEHAPATSATASPMKTTRLRCTARLSHTLNERLGYRPRGEALT